MTASGRFRALPLFWRVFLVNAAVLVSATLLLAVAPVTVSVPTSDEAVVLLVGLLSVLLLNVVFLRRTLRPLRALSDTMDRVDLLEPGRRVEMPDAGSDVRRLAAAFNEMLVRLEAEERESALMALTVQGGGAPADCPRVARRGGPDADRDALADREHLRRCAGAAARPPRRAPRDGAQRCGGCSPDRPAPAAGGAGVAERAGGALGPLCGPDRSGGDAPRRARPAAERGGRAGDLPAWRRRR